MTIADSIHAAAQRVGDDIHHALREVQQAWFSPTPQTFAQAAGPAATADPGSAAAPNGVVAGGGPSAKAPPGDIAAAPLQGPGTPDLERARADAQKTLDSIDWSKKNIVLWVPATGSHDAPKSWKDATAKAFDPATTSSAVVDYPADTNFPDSVSTGIETTRLVLAGIAQHGGAHTVTAGGHSQGAWVLGEVMSNPTVASGVDRAVLFGHPGAAEHGFTDHANPKVVEVDDPGDAFTWPIAGRDTALQGSKELHVGNAAAGVGDIAQAVVQNPKLAAYLVGRTVFPQDYRGEADPHHYENLYGDAASWLAAAT